MLFGSSAVSFALPPKQVFKCKCHCVTFDELGKRHEGPLVEIGTYDGSSCDIGPRTKCKVGRLEGTYASCTGPYKLKTGTIIPGGVLEQLENAPAGGVAPAPVAPSQK